MNLPAKWFQFSADYSWLMFVGGRDGNELTALLEVDVNAEDYTQSVSKVFNGDKIVVLVGKEPAFARDLDELTNVYSHLSKPERIFT